MRQAVLVCSAVLVLACPVWAGPGDLTLTIGGGRVTLIADSVPVRTILQEWARLGQSKIVNGEKVMGGPVTLRLINVPEGEALDIVLRSASGYLAAPRPVRLANASQFDRIVILATSRPTTSATAPMPMPQAQPQMQPQFPANPGVAPPVVEDEDEPQEEPAQPNPAQMPVTAPRPGFVGSPAAPAGVQPPPGQQPQIPATAARPGLIQPQPQPQQQPPPPPRPIPN